MYYKYGEWGVSSGWSKYLGNMDEGPEHWEGEDWESMEDEARWKALMASSLERIEEQQGWGVAAAFEGRVYAEGPPRY